MQHVTNFIKQLGENYYLDFIIEPYKDDFEYEDYYLLVQYQNKKYYELSLELINKRQEDIITNLKVLFKNSISELLVEIASKDSEKVNILLNSFIEAVKVNLKAIIDDFRIDDTKSRYYSILIDDYETFEIINKRYDEKYFSDLRTYNDEVLYIINRIGRKIYAINSEKETTIYSLENHINRHNILSSLPFKLFHIGQKFIFELDRIKKLNSVENTQPSNFIKMKDTYFDKFCELIDDYTILKKSTAIGVMIDLQLCMKEIKSETLLELQQNGINRNDHLEFKINEVEKCNYDKNADIHYVEKWLKNYNTTIDEILKNTFQSSSITGLIDSHYNDMEKFSKEKDLAFNIQSDFYQYFCKYYADELISYFKSKMVGIEKENNEDSENANQLSVNQAIILLDKLGVFNDKALENLSNVKKAKLISQLIGKNEKNIKTAIQKLELKPSEITPNYQKDIDKIERILENLE